MNIILVDDEPLEIEQLTFLIQKHYPKWNVYHAFDAAQALNICEKQHIDLSFLDIHLPGKDGLELGKLLKTKHTHMEFIIVTAFQTFEYAQTSIKLGVADFLTKPVIEEELVEVLNKFKHRGNYSPSIQQALSIIHQEFKDKLTLPYLSSKIHMSPIYFSRKFMEEVGIGFSEYLNKYRIEAAAGLLAKNPNLHISTIAEECGFNSQHYFSQQFKRYYGKTPREYKVEVTH
ncbi:response regulator [Sutcliffiella horikoshii]|uniref:response regulator transcription factor n=1 Tax=Sutcliffiella horikoshii TaxID=79883 RepID=UPI00384C497E